MPNVSKRPADAEKLDPQEQLKKLREALLRDAAARESDGENDAGEGAESAANRKKEAAARRFAGASGGSPSGVSSSQTGQKNVQEGGGGSSSASSSRDQSKGSSSGSLPSRQVAGRKEERSGLGSLSSLSALL